MFIFSGKKCKEIGKIFQIEICVKKYESASRIKELTHVFFILPAWDVSRISGVNNFKIWKNNIGFGSDQ